MLEVHLKSVLIMGVLTVMLIGSVIFSSMVGTSHAQYTNVPSPAPPPIKYPDPEKEIVNRGIQCQGPSYHPASCVNTTVPFAMPVNGIAMAQQAKDILTGLTIGKDGAMYVTFKAGSAPWKTVGISPKGIFPPAGKIAMAKQTNDILAALAIGNDGAMYVSWTGAGAWNKPAGATGPGPYPPVPISPKGVFHPGADIAMVKQTNDRLTGWAVGKNGWVYQAWVDGTGEWNKPVGRPIWICCQSHYTDQRGEPLTGTWKGFNGKQYNIAAHTLPNGRLAILIVDVAGELKMVPINGLCNVDRCENLKQGGVYPAIIGPWKLFPVGADVAMAQQAANLISSLAIGNNGAMYVSWTLGGGKWDGPVGISPPDMFPRGASIAMAKQTSDQLTALSVGKNGALHVSWTAPKGWQGPVGISPPNLFPPGAGIAMVNFNGVLEALIAGKDGSIYVSWTGPKGWEGPVRVY